MSNASDFKISKNGVLTKYQGKDSEVHIPTGVTEIGYAAFYNNYYLKRVQFPSDTTVIGAQAFEDCKNLEEIILPEGLTQIRSSAFRGCTNLKGVTFPESVTAIEQLAFYGCNLLADVTLPSRLVCLGADAFGGSSNLVDNKGFLVIGEYLLKYSGNNSHAKIPDGVTTICDNAFCAKHNDKIEHVTIPASVTRIGANAFMTCKRLKTVVIPAGVTSIESGTFLRCNALERVEIPASVASVKQDAFDSGSHKLQIFIEDISILPAKLRPYAAVCYANDGADDADPRCLGHVKYIKSQAEKLLDMAVAHPLLLQLMCNKNLITPKLTSLYTAAVQESGDPMLIATMLNYGATKQKAKSAESLPDIKPISDDHKGVDGLRFAVTGDLETFDNRKALKAFIESRGGALVSSVSAKVDHLICNDGTADSEKIVQAKSLGISVISEYQLNDLTGRQFIIDENGTLVSYIGAAETVTVPDNVIGLETEAFFNNDMIAEIQLPTNLRFVNSLAFCDCENLKSIFIPSKELEMDIAIISGCPSVTIHAPAGSYAETYAKEHNIPFVAE